MLAAGPKAEKAMTGSRISTTVTRSVLLDTKHHASPLTITRTGVIDVTQTYGAAAIYGARAGDTVINRGAVMGAVGANATKTVSSGNGGAGIDLTATGTITNSGLIAGGVGGYGSGYYEKSSGGGGDGIDAVGGRIVNSGMIQGGDTGQGYETQNGNAGAGILLSGPGVDLTNSGTIAGGFGLYSSGGAGVDFTAAGTLHNTGAIIGGGFQFSGTSAVGVGLASGSVLFNAGTITGSDGSTGVSAIESTIKNVGTITGGYGFSAYREGYQPGGVGVSFSGGQLTNNGMIVGGDGLIGYYYGGSGGGNGADDSGGILINNGAIEGGVNHFPAEYGRGQYYGVDLIGAASLTNHGTILGGAGGYNIYPETNGAGGNGLSVNASSIAVNLGMIQGGASTYFEASGGRGAVVNQGGVLTNLGTIAGGAGGYNGGYGGDGVYIHGGTLITAGTLIGGAGGTGGGVPGDAVRFSYNTAGTLVVEAGAVFDGDIAGSGNSGVTDTVVLAGNHAGTLSGFGTTITNITTIVQDAHTRWTLEGSIGGTGSIALGTGGYLALSDGTVSIASIVFGAGGNETLSFGAPGSVSSTLSGFGTGDRIDLANVQASSLSYSHGTLTLFDASHAVVDTLSFSGKYTAADFSLQQEGKSTDVVYAGRHEAALHVPEGGGHVAWPDVPAVVFLWPQR
jgi:hypothetical protein